MKNTVELSKAKDPKNRVSRLGFGRMIVGTIVLGLWLVSSCTYDKGEVIEPGPIDPVVILSYCDSIKAANSSTVSYLCDDIQSIMNADCTNGCHGSGLQGGLIFLNSYAEVKDVVDNYDMLCAINWVGNCINMPYLSATKIDSMDRVTIEKWIIQGMIE